jgi:hypothetical protein
MKLAAVDLRNAVYILFSLLSSDVEDGSLRPTGKTAYTQRSTQLIMGR